MTHPIPVHLPNDLFQALCNSTGEGFFGKDSAEALCQAVRDYLAVDRTETQGARRSEVGYQWKRLFLPEGTLLRATTHGNTIYAKVEGHAIVSDGQELSPSRLANCHGGVRNAWRVVWLRLPGHDWERADRCRD